MLQATVSFVLCVFVLSGCATVAGTALGPVTGTLTCVPKAIEVAANGKADWKIRLFSAITIPLAPILGMIVGFKTGNEIDERLSATGKFPDHTDFNNLLLPCP